MQEGALIISDMQWKLDMYDVELKLDPQLWSCTPMVEALCSISALIFFFGAIRQVEIRTLLTQT